jgi:hypothetical protein
MNRELLEKTFAPEQIKQRDGNFGKTLDHIEGHAIIQRMNDALTPSGPLRSLKFRSWKIRTRSLFKVS